MKQIPVGRIVIDYNLYPRVEVDSQHVSYMREALRAGASFPPIVIREKDKVVIDGVHRTKMYLAEFGDKHKVDVVEKSYRSDGEAFADAIRLNAGHGRTLTRFDRAHSLLKAEEMGLSVDETAKAMGLTVEALGKLRTERIGTLHVPGKKNTETPLKRTIAHMAGKSLTQVQVEANTKLGGMNQLFYVNQLITLIESELLDESNEQLVARLGVLSRLITKYGRRAA